MILSAVPYTAMAEAPYRAYVYDEWGQSKGSPNGYLPDKTYTGAEAGAEHFNEPQDMFVNNDLIYIADSGNSRIVILDKQFRKVDVINELSLNGKTVVLKHPTGIYVTKAGTLYVADEGRVLRVNQQKEIELVIEQPNHPLIAKDFQFKPIKVAADEAERIYVLSEGQFFGLMQFDSEGEFLSYFGSNKVEVTPYVVLETFWKKILSKEQRAGMAKLLPIEYSNLEIGPDGFVYTTTIISQNSREEIKKLNPLGNNVLVTENGGSDFGDKEITIKQGVKQDTSFVDLALNGEGFIAGLDRTRGRVFEYDMEGNPVTVFGALGNQQGTFLQPTAVAYLGNSLLVLDSGKRNITRFVLTEYGKLVHDATVLYKQGSYEEAADLWRSVAKRNSNNDATYIGIAKALENAGKYDEALLYYRLGADRDGYSETYTQVRIQSVRGNMPLIMTLLGCALFGYYGFKGYRYATRSRRRDNTLKLPVVFRKRVNPFRCLLHPFDGYYAVKEEGKGSVVIAGVIILLFFIASIMHRQNTGFIFNEHNLNDLNILLIAAKTIILYLLWVACNWAVATWMEGEGKAAEIGIISAYSLIPYIAALILVTSLSNVLVGEEGIFLDYIIVISMIWSAILMLIGLLTVHDYGFVRTVRSVALTFVAMGIVVFLAVLFYTLFQQAYVFLSTIYNELLFRL